MNTSLAHGIHTINRWVNYETGDDIMHQLLNSADNALYEFEMKLLDDLWEEARKYVEMKQEVNNENQSHRK